MRYPSEEDEQWVAEDLANCLPSEPPVRSSELVRRQIDNHPSLSPRERHNIKRALDAGEAYGYGNIMAWLATEWAVKLRDESGLPESVAIEAVSNRTPYALPPNAEVSEPGGPVASASASRVAPPGFAAPIGSSIRPMTTKNQSE